MNTTELKGNFLEMIAYVDDQRLLRQMFEQCLKLLRSHDIMDELPDEVVAMLEDAARRSYDEKNLIPHEMVKTEMKQWLTTLRG